MNFLYFRIMRFFSFGRKLEKAWYPETERTQTWGGSMDKLRGVLSVINSNHVGY